MTDNKSGEILIIEDDKDINDLLATALSKAGYRTRQAWSGTEGELLLKLDREAYALVLLDLMLPGLSGEELLARIRQMDASLPVIILTAKDELDEKINLLVAGADDYITKPFEILGGRCQSGCAAASCGGRCAFKVGPGRGKPDKSRK